VQKNGRLYKEGPSNIKDTQLLSGLVNWRGSLYCCSLLFSLLTACSNTQLWVDSLTVSLEHGLECIPHPRVYPRSPITNNLCSLNGATGLRVGQVWSQGGYRSPFTSNVSYTRLFSADKPRISKLELRDRSYQEYYSSKSDGGHLKVKTHVRSTYEGHQRRKREIIFKYRHFKIHIF